MAPLRIGMFGGAFDPPHLAHLALARLAVGQLRLDRLLVFPTGQAWHRSQATSDAGHRLAMARLAFSGLPRVEVDEREMLRAGPTYTVDTLRELAAGHPGASLFLVIGQDQAAALHTWHAWQDILRLATIAVAGRPAGPGAGQPVPDWAGGTVERLALPPMDVSATQIRQRAVAGQGIDQLVPAGVARYIDHHHLYQPA